MISIFKRKNNSKISNTDTKDKIIIGVFTLTLFIIIIFGSLNLMMFNKDFYYKEYAKNGVYEKISDNKAVAIDTTKNITTNIIKYFRNSAELEYFTDTEKSHMSDVKSLIHIMQAIYYSAAVLIIILFIYCSYKFKKDAIRFIRLITNSLIYSSSATIIFLISIFVMSVFYFNLMFMMFHLIFFPQGNWQFDSSSLLITLFPQQFFFDIALRIFIYALFQALVFFGIGRYLNKQLKIYDKHHH